MGKLLVVTKGGHDPLVAYRDRIPRHGSTQRHQDALRDLLGGVPVTVPDSEIAISVEADQTRTIFVRFPGDRFRTRMRVRAMTAAERRRYCPDERRKMPPAATDWYRAVRGGVRWALYGCVVEILLSDRV